MTLRYEVNPPKVIQSNVSHDELQRSLENIKQRIINISKNCNGIHITDSVLGIPRVSPLTLAALIREFSKKIEITISLRVIDKTLAALTQVVSDAVLLGLNGVLVLKGDASAESPKDSGLIPSQVVKHLNELDLNKKIDLFLSLPSNPDFKKIGKKLDAEPAGFITQVIHSEKQVTRIVDELKPQGFKVIPCILLPSEKNANSAKFLKLDWSGYQNSVVDFIKNIHSIAGDVLVSSPNDYAKAHELFKSINS